MTLKRAKSKRMWGWFLLDDLQEASSQKYPPFPEALKQRGYSMRPVTVTWRTPKPSAKPKGKR